LTIGMVKARGDTTFQLVKSGQYGRFIHELACPVGDHWPGP